MEILMPSADNSEEAVQDGKRSAAARYQGVLDQLKALTDRYEDLRLRVVAVETRQGADREQRERWFELLDGLTTEVLTNRDAIRAVENGAKP